MKKLLLCLGAFMLFGIIPANAWKVYFANPDNWSTVKIYFYGNNCQSCDWNTAPEMELGEFGLWTKEISGNLPQYVMFHNGNGSQYPANTGYTCVNGGYYNPDYKGTSTTYTPGWYLVGDSYGGFSTPNSKYLFTKVDDKTFTLEVENFSGAFKVTEVNGFSFYWDRSFGKIDNPSYPSFQVGTEYQTTKNAYDAIPYSGSEKNVKITIHTDSYKLLVEKPKSYPESLYIMGYAEGNAFDSNKGVKMDKVAEGVFTKKGVTFQPAPDNSDKLEQKYNSYFSFAEALGTSWNNDIRYGATDDGKLVDNVKQTVQSGAHAYLISAGTYDITVDLTKNEMTIYPTQLYIYGYMNDEYWDPDFGVDMLQTETPGIYKIEALEVQGRWSQNDQDEYHKGTAGDPTGDENYIGFYGHPVLDIKDFDFRKFGAESKNAHITPDTKDPQNLKFDGNNYNFKVDKGYYTLTVDLNKMQITFESVTNPNTKREVPYVWYSGMETGNVQKLDDQDNHEFTFGDEHVDVLQVAIGKDPGHKAAHQAHFEVWYRQPNSKKEIKARVNSAGLEAEGYRPAVASTDDIKGDYIEHGSTDIDDNHLIQLTNAGDYVLIASLSEDAQDVTNYSIPENSLYVTVAQASTDEVTIGSASQAFSTTGKNTFSGIVTYANNMSDSDITVSIKPVGTDWVSGSDDEATYESLLTASLFEQYKNLWKHGESNGTITDVTGVYPDGIYDSTKLSATVEDGNLVVSAPCSGEYEVTVSAASSGNYTFQPVNGNVTIYPNLYGVFGATPGINIEGYTFASDEDHNINLPTDLQGKDYLVAFIPGTYFAEEFSVESQYLAQEKSNVKAYAAAEENYEYAYRTAINLSEFTSGNQIEFNVSKNGVDAPKGSYVFKVNFTNSDFNQSVGVEGIEAEADSEAVYYNLQGVKVANPEKGIFIKVQNGKSSKVVL